MSRKVLTALDLSNIPPINLNLENLAAAPGTPGGVGRVYFNTSSGYPFFYDGAAWKTPFDRASHTGTQLAATISNLAVTVQGYSLDQFAAPAANVAMAGKRITGLADPVSAQDAATANWVTSQVQSAAAGISSKDPARVVSTANVSSLSGTPTVDGVALASGDRVLLTAQTTASQNGPWVVAAGAWARPSTEGAAYELDKGALWLVLEGTSYAGTQWRISNIGTITPGTTAITIVQFGAASALATGNGLAITSGTLNLVLLGGGGLVVSGPGLAIDTGVVARKYSATVGDGTATSFTVNHALNTRDVQVQVYQAAAPYSTVEVDVNRTDANNVAVVFATAPAAGAYRVVVNG